MWQFAYEIVNRPGRRIDDPAFSRRLRRSSTLMQERNGLMPPMRNSAVMSMNVDHCARRKIVFLRSLNYSIEFA
jgi:hypothetical protein